MSKSYIRLLDKANREILRFFHRTMTENRKKTNENSKIFVNYLFLFFRTVQAIDINLKSVLNERLIISMLQETRKE
jgi:hypothetical protein